VKREKPEGLRLGRKVNLLAHHALTAAALARKQAVAAEHVQAALPEVT